MLSRRDALKILATMGIGSSGLSSYAVAEAFQEKVTRYRLTPPRWAPGLDLKLVVLTDLHVCEPWMSVERLEGIVEETNALNPDAVLLLGDFVVGRGLAKYSKPVGDAVWAAALGKLRAPLGVHAVLGNHDWWEEVSVQRRRSGPTRAGLALEAAGIPVYQNNAVRLQKNGQPFWIAGLGDQWAFWPIPDESAVITKHPKYNFDGVDDLPGTLSQITDDAPVLLMVHEPDIFPKVPDRVSLTLAGHTHGGQVRILGYAPVVPSRYGERYVYGHMIEEGRHLIVSGGLGCSTLPIRFGAPPEIVVVDLAHGVEA